MDEERCWEIVEAARADAGTAWDSLDERLEAALVAHLVTLSPPEVARFDDFFRALQRQVRARQDMFMAAFLIHHGCGDDSFADFCAGLVGLGRDWYGRALADPDVLAEHPAVLGVAAGTVNVSVLLTEGFHVAPERALADLTGEEYDGYFTTGEPAPVTVLPAAAVVLPRRLERLAAMFPRQQEHLRQAYPQLTS